MISKPVIQGEQMYLPGLAVENAKLKQQLDVSQAESRRLRRLLHANLDPHKPVGMADNLV
jgi:hypothetical protein